MGFTEEMVAKALKKTRNAGLQPAMDWLLEHGDDADDMEDEVEETQEIPAADQPPAVVLTEEERKVKLEELKVKMAAKREQKRLQAIEDEKSKEKVRRTTGQEMQAIKEKLQADEMAKQVAERKREKDEGSLG
jgi:UBX domain-containing protein 1/4